MIFYLRPNWEARRAAGDCFFHASTAPFSNWTPVHVAGSFSFLEFDPETTQGRLAPADTDLLEQTE